MEIMKGKKKTVKGGRLESARKDQGQKIVREHREESTLFKHAHIKCRGPWSGPERKWPGNVRGH